MISRQTPIRVRYRDTDQMGVVYHSVYLEYFETGRTELLRQIGMPYVDIERSGLMLPVLDLGLTIRRPARYDDLLDLHSTILEMPAARMRIEYELRLDGELLVTGHTTHAFVRSSDLRPVRPPQFFVEGIEVAATESVSD